MRHVTESGYTVVETTSGIDVYDEEEFVCELSGRTLSQFKYNGKVNDDKLEDAIKEELEVEKIINDFCWKKMSWLTLFNTKYLDNRKKKCTFANVNNEGTPKLKL